MNNQPWDVTQLQPGEHVCYLYDTEEEHRAVFTPFLAHALAQGERVIYLCDSHPVDVIERYVEAGGFSVAECRANGQLVLADRVALGLGRREALARWLAAAVATSDRLCRISCELTWTLDDIITPEQMSAYERWVEETFTGEACISLTQYDRQQANPVALLEIVNAHPTVLVGQKLYKHAEANRGETAAGRPLLAVTLQQWLESLDERKRAQEALKESLYFLQVLIDAIPLPIFYKDAQGRYRGCNAAFEAMQGVQRAELIGKSVYDIAPKALADVYFRMDADLFAHPGTQIYESQVRYAGGSTHDVVFNKATFTTMDGTLAGLVGVIMDITKRKQIEAALRESETRYRLISELTSDFAYALRVEPDETMTFEWATEAFSRITGYRLEEAAALQHWRTIVHPDDLPLYTRLVTGLLHGEQQETDLRIIAKGGEQRWLHVQGRPVFDAEEQRIIRIYGTARDITERKQMELYLLRTERLSAMGRLAAALAHEINNPLQAIQSNLELALDFPLEETERRQYLVAVRAEIERLMNVTHQVLDFARPLQLEIGKTEPVAIPDVVLYALTLCNKELQDHAIEVQLSLSNNLPTIAGARDLLTQVCLNLIINAIEAMPTGGTLQVEARISRKHKKVELTFADTGPGIAPEALDMIFEPFYTTKEHGTGMGLPLSYGIIQQHGGTITAENRKSGGARVRVTLPLARKGESGKDEG